MRTLFAVTRARGPAWDKSKSLRSQAQWTEHADFMNRLAESGFIILGGPVGDSGDVLLIIDATTEEKITSKLSEDPWSASRLLEIKSIQPWNILLESPARSSDVR
jgi:uncharacterized protein YciI